MGKLDDKLCDFMIQDFIISNDTIEKSDQKANFLVSLYFTLLGGIIIAVFSNLENYADAPNNNYLFYIICGSITMIILGQMLVLHLLTAYGHTVLFINKMNSIRGFITKFCGVTNYPLSGRVATAGANKLRMAKFYNMLIILELCFVFPCLLFSTILPVYNYKFYKKRMRKVNKTIDSFYIKLDFSPSPLFYQGSVHRINLEYLKKRDLLRTHPPTFKAFSYADSYNESIFPGIISLIHAEEVYEPIIKHGTGQCVCILDKGYYWLQLAPRELNYWITVIFDSTQTLIQYCIDVTAENVLLPDGKAYFYDLYLDLIITPDGKMFAMDQDELNDAYYKNHITKEQYEKAQEDLYKLQMYCSSPQHMEKLYNLSMEAFINLKQQIEK